MDPNFEASWKANITTIAKIIPDWFGREMFCIFDPSTDIFYIYLLHTLFIDQLSIQLNSTQLSEE